MYKGVSLSDNHSGYGALVGGAIRFNTNGVFNMYGGSIHDNSSDAACLGGAIMIDVENVTFNMYDGTFENNKTCISQYGAYGGAILSTSATALVNIEGGSFIGNQSSYGGAIGMYAGTLKIKDALFEGNEGQSYGGAIINISQIEVVIQNTIFKKNSGGNGGAFTSYGGNVTIKNSVFEENEGSNGGAIRNINGTLTSENNKYIKNKASNGGAIISRTSLVSRNDLITENEANRAGGIYLEGNAITDVSKTKIYNNKATTAANDIYISSTAGATTLKDAATFNATATFDDEQVSIDGWYKDSSEPRYTITNPTEKVAYNSVATGTEYFLTAAGPVVYTVKFNGADIEDELVSPNQKVTKPTNPTKEGYEFVGWYLDENYTTEFDFNTSINKNTNLYAKWKEVSTSNTTTSNSEKNPDTGDSIMLFVSMFGISALAILAIVIYKKKTV